MEEGLSMICFITRWILHRDSVIVQVSFLSTEARREASPGAKTTRYFWLSIRRGNCTVITGLSTIPEASKRRKLFLAI